MAHVPALRGSRRSHALVALTAALSVVLAGLGFSLATPANAANTALPAQLLVGAIRGRAPDGSNRRHVTHRSSDYTVSPAPQAPLAWLPESGLIAGTPTAATATALTFVVTAADGNDPTITVSSDITITVNGTITAPGPIGAFVGTQLTKTLPASRPPDSAPTSPTPQTPFLLV